LAVSTAALKCISSNKEWTDSSKLKAQSSKQLQYLTEGGRHWLQRKNGLDKIKKDAMKKIKEKPMNTPVILEVFSDYI
jgi:hypothetical protein